MKKANEMTGKNPMRTITNCGDCKDEMRPNLTSPAIGRIEHSVAQVIDVGGSLCKRQSVFASTQDFFTTDLVEVSRNQRMWARVGKQVLINST
ncbi:predicted protein [Sclerotinia sclerotiorum 1980 UF-70]|uniref:Uncharacterized protein n=1 Tax=Sclerotinia sclerotiorum (strain ATCC 18683 / 1980 / Ss-1) TaxID=665079 RepID=A7F3A4_SCLS1|nr:predicted protein [Sclerotinia sclerotiorum 1980 UF-70]EDN97225.1 predicted protein [Sclerotinia sclerotiorum 1980 UF-70]